MMTRFPLLAALALCAGAHMTASAAPDTALASLYGPIKPGPSQRMNPLASASVILPDTSADEWPAIRARIRQRVLHHLGTGPVPLAPQTGTRFEEVRRYRNAGLDHVLYRYQIVDDIWGEAILVMPKDAASGGALRAVLTIHGTNGADGKMGAIDIDGKPHRAYGIELARRGYATLSPDLPGFGASIGGSSQQAVVNAILAKYPDWSYRGAKLLALMRAIDILDQLPAIDKGQYGAMGNSLGGGMGLYLAALDSRVHAAVLSTGVSPAATNVYRLAAGGAQEEPARWKAIARDGKPPYDIHEIAALCAPRAMYFIEPFNDPYNPDTQASFHAIHQAMQVYGLLGTPGNIAMLVHGRGHDTPPDVREPAYAWFERHLPARRP